MTGPATLDDVRRSATDNAFPTGILDRCETALVLFAAGFHGRNDAVWIADAGITATCVDQDAEKLDEMQKIYPKDWRFIRSNVYDLIRVEHGVFDLVTADPWSTRFDECGRIVPQLCGLARVAVVVGTGKDQTIEEPVGWQVSQKIHRSFFRGGVFWTVLEPVDG